MLRVSCLKDEWEFNFFSTFDNHTYLNYEPYNGSTALQFYGSAALQLYNSTALGSHNSYLDNKFSASKALQPCISR